jgi:hypothetical protein
MNCHSDPALDAGEESLEEITRKDPSPMAQDESFK